MRPIDRTRDTPWMWWCGPIRLNLLIRLGVFSPHPTWVTGGGRNQSGARFGRQLPPPDATPLPYRRPRTTCRPVRRQGIAVAVPRTRRSIATVRAGDNRQPLWRQPIERWSRSSRCAELIPAGRNPRRMGISPKSPNPKVCGEYVPDRSPDGIPATVSGFFEQRP